VASQSAWFGPDPPEQCAMPGAMNSRTEFSVRAAPIVDRTLS
jgi:hypothetical protein